MDWQPIETAPKDLTEVLVWSWDLGVTTAQYEHRAAEPFWNCDVHDLGQGFDGKIDPPPTHWMPLPKAPALVVLAERTN